MIFGGLQKHSLIDFPGKMSCVLFLCGCNFRCPYCHNPDLARGCPSCETRVSEGDVFAFLEQRRGLLDGVVVSGGEPTLAPDLPALCARLQNMGFSVKLDTNGSRPRVLHHLIEAGLVDYVAMDVKTDPLHYDLLAREHGTLSQILTSIQLILDSSVDYEFRTTCVRALVTESAIATIARMIQGAKRYLLQRFRPEEVLDPSFFKDRNSTFTEDELLQFQALAQPWVQECRLR
ncbi:MAG: anaerobic ribonucleoside-triphosphate reductase activating protein [Desulfobacteraceae bacterium]|jgi:pyruvate formate lyase activating enzyme